MTTRLLKSLDWQSDSLLQLWLFDKCFAANFLCSNILENGQQSNKFYEADWDLKPDLQKKRPLDL